MDDSAGAGAHPVRLDETGRYRLSPDISADHLIRRYRRQLWLIATPLFVLLAALAVWQAWQARTAALLEMERQAAQQHAALQTLARIVSDHLADLHLLVEGELIAPSRPLADHALQEALQPRMLRDGSVDGFALDSLPPLLHAGSAQLLWPGSEPPPAGALSLTQAISRTAERAHGRHVELAASRWMAWPQRWVAQYPFEPSRAVLERWRVERLGTAFDRMYSAETFAAGTPQANPERRNYWTAVQGQAQGLGQGQPWVTHAAPVYDGDDFRGVVAVQLRVSAIARAAAVPLGDARGAGGWWVVSARGEVLAAKDGAVTLPAGLDAAALAQARVLGGQAQALAGQRVVALDVGDAPWTLVLALGDAELAGRMLPRLLPFSLIALALLGMFLLAQSMLRRRVIEPALGVMGYMHAKSIDADAPEPDLPPRWRPWARVVTRTFDDQRAARAAERRSEAFKSAIVDHALAALVATDAQGRIVEFNPAAEAMFGHRRAAVLGRPVGEVIVPPRHREAHEAGLRRAAAGGVTRMLGRRVEMDALRADGREFPVEMLLWRADVAGAPIFTASLVDLSERRQAQHEIERQREALRQSEKLSAMGGLLAGVAHELNNPLAIVLGRASLLEDKCEQQPELRVDAQRIREAAERCGRIVRTFLNMARSRPSQRAPVAFNELVQAATEMLAYTWRGHGIHLELALAEELPKVSADADQIGQVVLNLLVNAQQALVSSAGERRVRVSTGLEPPRAGRQPRVWLRVADSGPGIASELAERVFEPYFTTKAEGIGTGLGLAVSRALVQEHGGTLALEPARPLGGACFRMSLPLSGEAGTPTGPMDLADEAGQAPRSRVLVVDDEHEVAETIRDMLESGGHEVAVAESGAVALELLDTARFDAIVSDLRMPDMDGAALWQQVRQRHPALAARMLFITGDTLSPGSRAFLDEAGCPRLDKPFSRTDLAAGVAALLA